MKAKSRTMSVVGDVKEAAADLKKLQMKVGDTLKDLRIGLTKLLSSTAKLFGKKEVFLYTPELLESDMTPTLSSVSLHALPRNFADYFCDEHGSLYVRDYTRGSTPICVRKVGTNEQFTEFINRADLDALIGLLESELFSTD